MDAVTVSQTRIAILRRLEEAGIEHDPCPHPEYRHIYAALKRSDETVLSVCALYNFWFEEAVELTLSYPAPADAYMELELAENLIKTRQYRNFAIYYRHPKAEYDTYSMLIWLYNFDFDESEMKVVTNILVQNERYNPAIFCYLRLYELPVVAEMHFRVTNRPIEIPGLPHISAELNLFKNRLIEECNWDEPRPRRWNLNLDRLCNHLPPHLLRHAKSVAGSMDLNLGFAGPR